MLELLAMTSSTLKDENVNPRSNRTPATLE
jgi:hypothetical protein